MVAKRNNNKKNLTMQHLTKHGSPKTYSN